MFSQLHLSVRLTIQTIALALIACLMSASFMSAPAHARKAKAKSFSVRAAVNSPAEDPHTIIISSDGTKWDRVKETDITIGMVAHLRMRGRGLVDKIAVFRGQCLRNNCFTHQQLLGVPVASVSQVTP